MAESLGSDMYQMLVSTQSAYIQSNPNTQRLDPSMVRIIERKLDMLLLASSFANTLEAQRDYRSVKEVEFRKSYDILFLAFYVQDLSEDVSENIRYVTGFLSHC